MESNNEIYECKIRGILKRDNLKELCIAGDYVLFSKEEKVITGVEPRKNFIQRPLACNIDILFVCLAAKSPDLDTDVINLMLLNAAVTNINPIVIINKIDLLSPEEKDILKKKLSFLDTLNIPFYLLSTISDKDFDMLKSLLNNNICVFGGPSGVGKSSIVNKLQSTVTLQIGEVSKKTHRGKHTTRETALIKLDCGGYIVDTPGFGFLDPPPIKNKTDFFKCFPDIKGEKDCYYRNCSHLSEPKCGVKESVASGLISTVRYNFFIKMYNLFNERWSSYD